MTTQDLSALAEVHAVLAKHGLEKRFGVRMNHAHFPLQPGEMLHETHDKSSRTMTISARKTSDIPAEATPTQWHFDANGLPVADQYCCDPPAA
ncbi:MAG TPA: hypothetical protein VHP58_01120 [Alphaproteobacteria bacterium]|nr:hypothetical protein [Alphaproteobacteria bacterium]